MVGVKLNDVKMKLLGNPTKRSDERSDERFDERFDERSDERFDERSDERSDRGLMKQNDFVFILPRQNVAIQVGSNREISSEAICAEVKIKKLSYW